MWGFLLHNKGLLIAAWILLLSLVSPAFASSLPPNNQPVISGSTNSAVQTSQNVPPPDDSINPVAETDIARYTKWLAFFTFALVVTAGIQIKYLIRADTTARIAAEAAKKSADIAVSSTRPYVLVDGFHITRRELPGEPIKPNAWMTEVRFKNAGNTPARIETVEVILSPLEELSEVPDYGNAFTPRVVYTLTANQTYTTQGTGPSDEIATKNGKPVDFVIYGRIIYLDLAGNEFRTGFAQQIASHMPACSGIKNEAYTYIT